MKKIRIRLLLIIIICFAVQIFADTTKAAATNTRDTWISEEYIAYCEEIGEKYNVCPELLIAMIEKESSGQANVSNGSCKGLMQVSEKWHSGRMKKLGVTDLYDPYSNILVGTDYLMELVGEYGDLPLVLMVYNGSSDAQNRLEGGNLTEYATGIMQRSEELERIHGK